MDSFECERLGMALPVFRPDDTAITGVLPGYPAKVNATFFALTSCVVIIGCPLRIKLHEMKGADDHC